MNKHYRSEGLRVLGFPCNDFGGQEPGTNDEIKTFCETKFGVTFELFDKVHAIGPEQHPLYRQLSSFPEPTNVAWNFEKFVVDKHGNVVARFKSAVAPESDQLLAVIDSELAK